MQSFILFSGLKHHRHTLRDFIENPANEQILQLRGKLLAIGNSLMDLYIGELTETEIYEEIIEILSAQNAVPEEKYRQFLHPHHYRTVTLSDTSQWVLRWGEKPNRHIHIHPGRYSPHTLRVKATTLKTAIAALIWRRQFAQALDTPLLNRLRKDILGLSPVRDLSEAYSVAKVMDVLSG